MANENFSEDSLTSLAGFIGECACSNVRLVSRAITRMYDEAIEQTGLRITQLSVLATLQQMGSSTVSALADNLLLDRTTLSRNLKPLTRSGLIRVLVAEDSRSRAVSLTEEGQTILRQAMPLWRKAQVRVKEMLGEERIQGLVSDLTSGLRPI
ncbi:MAG: MarR family winged helix-turn-helix transcriptional regulator [Gammaproteobacteria bacterium]|nr:MarR family winged helix-turn-helix transcriptional regulator [Gammaproteobacteria bacterium]